MFFCLIFCVGNYSLGQDYVFASLGGVPINTNGWNMQGAAKVGSTQGQPFNGEIILTDPLNTQSGAIFYNTPINLAQCKKWVAEYECRIFDGNAADGLAFCYLDVPPSGFVSGGGIGIPATANGLKIVLDTWRNCGTDAVPKLQIRWGPGYEECNGQPTRNNNDGTLGFIRANNYNKCRVEYEEGNIRVFINGTLYLTGFQNFDFTGYFGFTASTGGFNDRHSIRNVRIFTEMPASTAGVDLETCSAKPIQIGPTPLPGLAYKWIPESGLSSPNIANPIATITNDSDEDFFQQFILETSFADRPGCASRDSMVLTILANPKPDFVHDTVCLPGGTVSFSNQTTWRGNTSAIASLAWQWDFGNPASGAANASTTTNPKHFFDRSQNYNVTLKAITEKGCSNSIVKSILPVVAPPVVGFSLSGDTCSGYQIVFSSQVVQNPLLPLLYSWNFGDGNTQNIPNPTHIFLNPATFNVRLSVASPYCPAVTVSKPITIKASPVLAVSNPEIEVCKDAATFILNEVRVTNGIAGQGVYSGPGVANGSFSPVLAGVGQNRITYLFTGNNGCNADTAFSITVWPLPDINAGADKILIEGLPIQLNGKAEQGVDFVWAPAQYLTSPTVLNPFANPPVDTWFVLAGENEQGCIMMDSVFVKVLPAFKIPNVFSPNGDGINDFWEIRGLSAYPNSRLQVFDRYGKLVFSSVGYPKPWDGTQQGRVLPSGVFYYILDPGFGAKPRQGSVTIVK